MFRAGHGLLTVSTMAALSRQVYARMATLTARPGNRARRSTNSRKRVMLAPAVDRARYGQRDNA
jgi:hypothetical protein